MWRAARQEDLGKIESFLYRHVQSSMFPLANLRNFGLNGSDPRAVRMWVIGDDPRAVFTITNEGMILPQCPDCTDHELLSALALIGDGPFTGVIGEAAQARRIIRLAGWQDKAAVMDEDEPSFSLNLEALILPEMSRSRLVPLADIDRAKAIAWRRAYLIETPGFLAKEATHQATCDVESYLVRDSHRALLIDGQPVAMTGFNAALPDVVQIGGVYTPPNLRCRGYARTAVALHLNEARESGVTRAILFAASESAARAYMAIGFAPVGKFALILFQAEKEATA